MCQNANKIPVLFQGSKMKQFMRCLFSGPVFLLFALLIITGFFVIKCTVFPPWYISVCKTFCNDHGSYMDDVDGIMDDKQKLLEHYVKYKCICGNGAAKIIQPAYIPNEEDKAIK